MWTRSAARRKFSVSATATKYLRWRSSMDHSEASDVRPVNSSGSSRNTAGSSLNSPGSSLNSPDSSRPALEGLFSESKKPSIAGRLGVFARKPMEAFTAEAHGSSGPRLQRTLGVIDLIAFGVGCTVGAGIFSLTGEVAAHQAGPAVS